MSALIKEYGDHCVTFINGDELAENVIEDHGTEPEAWEDPTWVAPLRQDQAYYGVVLAVEDLHWIDQTSQEFLDYLIDWLAPTRILLVLLYRPEYDHTWNRKSYYIRIGLDQLSTENSANLVQSILEGGEVGPDLREQCHTVVVYTTHRPKQGHIASHRQGEVVL